MNWDLTTLARKANLDPSTLTRPANDPRHTTRLSLKTLRRIQETTGIPMPPGMDPAPAKDALETETAMLIYDALPEGRPLSRDDRRRLTNSILQIVRRQRGR